MKPILCAGIIVLVIQVCGCATEQRFSDSDAHYTVTWVRDKVSRVECRSENLPDGLLLVSISRGSRYKKVLINDDKKNVWAKSTFKSGADILSSSGVVFYEESKQVDSYRFEIKEWKLETSNVLIYKEIIVNDEESGHFKRQEFFGPFGKVLKLNK